jgi:hypothetical protein
MKNSRKKVNPAMLEIATMSESAAHANQTIARAFSLDRGVAKRDLTNYKLPSVES